MKNSKRKIAVRRIYLEALVIGLSIGGSALVLDRLVGDASLLVRVVSLIVVGGLLCLVQYGLTRTRR
jgi:hypothetical protein